MKRQHRLTPILALLLCPAAAFGGDTDRIKATESIIDSIRRYDAPDRRTTVYDITAHQNGNTLLLRGNISDTATHTRLMQALLKHGITAVDSIRRLPEHTIGDTHHWGIIPLSAIYIRKEPSFRAEIVTQALLGTPVKILDKKNGWLLIQTPDRYIGWTNTTIEPISRKQLDQANSTPKAIVICHHAQLYTRPSRKSAPIMEVIMGNILTLQSPANGRRFATVSLPDGTTAYIATQHIRPLTRWWQSVSLTGQSIVELGQQFIGLPYLWGGTSARGMDCSGFTKTLFFMHGLILPRDASQQFYCGTPVDTTNGWHNLQQGDLLFFGTRSEQQPETLRITHVALSMGGARFIHASGKVKINSLNPTDTDYDTYNTPRLLGVRRIIGAAPVGLWHITEHEWYGQTTNH